MEDVEFKISAASTQSRLACSGELDEINKRDYLLKVETNIPTCKIPHRKGFGLSEVEKVTKCHLGHQMKPAYEGHFELLDGDSWEAHSMVRIAIVSTRCISRHDSPQDLAGLLAQ